MSRITFCSAPSWATLLEKSDEWLNEKNKPTLFLIPQNWQSQNLQQSFPGSQTLTTTQLLQRYINKKFDEKQLLSKQSVEYLLLSVIFKTSPGDEQTVARYLNIETYYQGYARALTEFILDFRENGQENLLTALNAFKRDVLTAKEHDLVDIHDELENLLKENDLFDYRRAVFDFLEDKETGKPEVFLPELSDAKLVIAGFNHINFLESKLIGWLMYRFRMSIFTFCENSNAAEATFKSQNSIQDFINKAKQVFKENFEDVKILSPAKTPLQPLAELLFVDDKKELLPGSTTNVFIKSSNDRYNEVTLIARQIRQLLSEGVPHQHIRVIFPNYETYVSLLREVFPRYEIPFKLSSGTPLPFFPLAQLLSNMINQAVVASPFALREHIFSSPYITFSLEVTADVLIKFVTNISVELSAIQETIDKFLSNPTSFTLNYSWLQAVQKKAAQTIRSSEKLHPLQLVVRYFNKLYENNREKNLQQIFKAVINYFLLARAERALYVWRNEMEVPAFTAAFERLVQRFQIEKNMNESGRQNNDTLKTVIEQDKLVLETIRKIIKHLEQQLSTLAVKSEQKFPLTDLARSFSSLMSDPEFYLSDGGTEGVAIFTQDEASLKFMPVTFIGGLIDGEFPAKEPFNFLQPKKEGEVLSDSLSFVDRDRQIFYQLIAATTEKLYISNPVSDNGKKLLVSPFVTEIQKCFSEGENLTATINEKLYTSREKLAYLGQHVDRSFESTMPLLKEFQENSPEFFNQIISIFQCDGLRGSVKSFSLFDGLFYSPVAIAAIREQIDVSFVFNVEKLERFAGCPLRFLFDDLLQLKPDFLYDYHPDRTERGILIKKILTDYTKVASTEGRVPGNAAEILQQSAASALEEILNEKEDLFNIRFKRGLTVGLDQDEKTKRKRPGLLAAFLKNEKTAKDLIEPYFADIVFENENGNRFLLDNIPINIKIERVDKTKDGKFLLIYNYSIADFGNVEGIGKGLRFNLPLQIIALRDYLRRLKKEDKVAGAGIYLVRNYRNIKHGGYFAIKDLQATREEKVTEETPIISGQRKFGFLPAANFEEELDNVKKRVVHIKNLIQRGRFHLPICTVKDQTCANCYFTRICRKEQLRLDNLYLQLDEKDVYKPKRRLVD
ncbi:PD-(D/E)XK nuclease family protein [candidate division KSB1 bacterium]|nr:PD-(D/E)XK nuclease family protein [candidate division KSB1 bacterium]